MKKESLLYGIIGLLGGIVLATVFAVVAVNNDNDTMMRMMGMDTRENDSSEASSMGGMDHSSMSMDDMSESLSGKQGDEFDQAFLEEMIVHHQGAIDMATLAKTNAKHAELKTMADAIISAQSAEIQQMQDWQTQWGYR